MGKVVKQAGKNTAQQKRANGDSYKKQLAKLAGNDRGKNHPPKPGKKPW